MHPFPDFFSFRRTRNNNPETPSFLSLFVLVDELTGEGYVWVIKVPQLCWSILPSETTPPVQYHLCYGASKFYSESLTCSIGSPSCKRCLGHGVRIQFWGVVGDSILLA